MQLNTLNDIPNLIILPILVFLFDVTEINVFTFVVLLQDETLKRKLKY